jgi:hypothetical protein
VLAQRSEGAPAPQRHPASDDGPGRVPSYALRGPTAGDSRPESGARRRFFFVHVQKTAGTTLRQRLRNFLGEESLYPSEVDGGNIHELVMSIDRLVRGIRERGDEVQVVAGHFPLCAVELLPGPFTTLTVLREPIERTLSYLRHHREWTPEDQSRSLEEIYDDPFRFHGLIHNHMVKMFSLSVDEMTDGMLTHVEFGPDRLERAKQRLATVDEIGFQDGFQAFCDELDRRYGWRLGDRPRFANRSTSVEVSPAFRARIAEDNADDIELYEFARQLAAGRPESVVRG